MYGAIETLKEKANTFNVCPSQLYTKINALGEVVMVRSMQRKPKIEGVRGWLIKVQPHTWRTPQKFKSKKLEK